MVQVQEFYPDTGWSEAQEVQLDPVLNAQDLRHLLMAELVEGTEYL